MGAVADGAYANLELPTVLRRWRLGGRDAAFATELVHGTIRMQGLYDEVIAVAANRPTSRIDSGVLDTLRLGVHQLLGMRVPAHAATSETVALSRTVNGAGAATLVNAVLRRVAERDRDSWLAEVTPEGPLLDQLAVIHSHPRWIVSALRQALIGHGAVDGTDAAAVHTELVDLLRADNAAPRVHLVARPRLVDPGELVADSGGTPAPFSPLGVVLDRGDPGRVAAVREGRAAVQDEGSQLLALALAAAPLSSRPDAGAEREGDPPPAWLDLCAGPGGKAGVLAGLAGRQGADLVAVESSPHRADLVRATLGAARDDAARRGRTIEVRTADGREVGGTEPGRYDRVLVDAPCTGLGALRRRPEARWRRQSSDLATLGPLQRDLLRSALDAVRVGGVVAYATCSPHLAETVFVVKDVAGRRDDVEVLDARDAVSRVANPGTLAPEDLGPGPYVQLWPHRHGTDAMFVALLRRIG